MKCERCGATVNTWTTSYFNTQNICMDCRGKERAHPKFEEARQADITAIRAGDYNFPGIGKPEDL